ncbi:hypothetical protein GCM10023178_14680 [Actinomadura luteofluorescens]
MTLRDSDSSSIASLTRYSRAGGAVSAALALVMVIGLGPPMPTQAGPNRPGPYVSTGVRQDA